MSVRVIIACELECELKCKLADPTIVVEGVVELKELKKRKTKRTHLCESKQTNVSFMKLCVCVYTVHT